MADLSVNPLNWQVPIVNPDGTPTTEFQRKWAQQAALNAEIQNIATAAEISAALDKLGAAEGDMLVRGVSTWEALSPGTAGQILTSAGAGAIPVYDSLSTILDLTSNVRGSILYRGATGWTALPPSTLGYILTDGGVGADPSWLPNSGGGGGSSHTVPAYIPGRWYTQLTNMAAASLITGVSGTIYAAPMLVSDALTVAALGVHALGGANARLGIYDNIGGLPGTLILDAGTHAIVSGFNSIGSLSQLLTADWYWLALMVDTNVNIYGYPAAALDPLLGNPGNFASLGASITAAQAFGAMPGTFPAVTYGTGVTPIIGISA